MCIRDRYISTLETSMFERTLSLTFSEDAYLFFTANYDILFSEVEEQMNIFMDSGNSNLDSLISFYLIITIVGLVAAILLQLINMPFLLNSFTLQEKLLTLISRVNEKDCAIEIALYNGYIANLNSLYDNYNLFSKKNISSQSHTQLIVNQLKGEEMDQKKMKKTVALSNQILNQKLKKIRVYTSAIISMVIVTIFFFDCVFNKINSEQQINLICDYEQIIC
eukprot:TRINITY_DN1761_c0_g1_i4.p2 TRINITY_DN1761_c0_g1~~TRINITY_DN1761_c0_g1_i4.p2  ORF type:complete len:222 (-),score=20.62 TRINITY_DN1761_c0_g1_i4:762-1427(-)